MKHESIISKIFLTRRDHSKSPSVRSYIGVNLEMEPNFEARQNFLFDIAKSVEIYWVDRVQTGVIEIRNPEIYHTSLLLSDFSISPYELNPDNGSVDKNMYHVWTGDIGYCEIFYMCDDCVTAASKEGRLTQNERRLKHIYEICMKELI